MLWSRRYNFIILFISICSITFSSSWTFADNIDKQETTNNSSQLEQTKAPTIGDKTIKLFMDKIEVLGRLEKPQAVFIVPGINPEVDDIRMDRNFFPEIFRQVEKVGRRGTLSQRKKINRRKDFIPW